MLSQTAMAFLGIDTDHGPEIYEIIDLTYPHPGRAKIPQAEADRFVRMCQATVDALQAINELLESERKDDHPTNDR